MNKYYFYRPSAEAQSTAMDSNTQAPANDWRYRLPDFNSKIPYKWVPNLYLAQWTLCAIFMCRVLCIMQDRQLKCARNVSILIPLMGFPRCLCCAINCCNLWDHPFEPPTTTRQARTARKAKPHEHNRASMLFRTTIDNFKFILGMLGT